MKQETLKKTMVISGVVGSIVLLNNTTTHAVENTNNTDTSHQETLSSRTSNKGQVVGVGSTCLRIRSNPSTDSEILGTMREGIKFDIISKDNGWYKIRYNGITGYAYGEYVQEINSASTENVLYYGKVHNVTDNLRVRSGSSLNASIIGYLTNNTSVSIVAAEEDWYKIKYSGAYGYVHRDYILVGGSDTDVPDSGNDNSNNEDTTVKSTGYAYNLNGSSLRVREKASTNSNILGNIYEGDSVNIISEENGWYKILYNNKVAFVSKNYITKNKPSDNNNGSNNNGSSGSGSNDVITSQGKVVNIDTNLRVRKGPSSSHQVLGYLLNNETVDIYSKEGNWYKIDYKNSIGYVSADYISVNGNNTSGNGGNNSGESDNSQSQAFDIILNAMKSQIGAPYVWGGSGEYLTTASLNNLKSRFPSEAANGDYRYAEQYVDQGYRAFDCSGLMQWGFAQANINIGRTTYAQINNGVEVSVNEAKAGDLLFTDNLGHVAMYIGNNQWIESPNVGDTVKIATVNWGRVQRARRILK